jgi:Tfp pilus assembly protein PilF
MASFEALGKDVEQGLSHIAMGHVYEVQRETAAAAEQYRIAIAMVEKAGDARGVKDARVRLARIEDAAKSE